VIRALPHRAPFDGRAMLEYLGRDPHDAVDVVAGATYRRVVDLESNRAAVELRFEGGETRLRTAGWERTPHRDERARMREAAARIVSADVDLSAFARAVAGDPLMAELVARFRGVKVPQTPTPFDALTWAILGQQISTAFAHALKRRLAVAHGEPLTVRGAAWHALPRPERLACLDPEALTVLGTTRAKSRAIVGAARAVAAGSLDFAALEGLETEAAIERLCALHGVGRWTSEYVAMRGLGRTDSLPAGDVALQRAAATRYGSRYRSPEGLRRLARRWRGWESYATFYLWRTLSKPAG